MDALELSRQEHDQILEILELLEHTTAQAPLLNQLRTLLSHHNYQEDRFLHDALRAFPEARDLVEESCQDNRQVMDVLEQLQLPEVDWLGWLGDLRRDFERHAEDQERRLFPTAAVLLGSRRLDELGQLMALALMPQEERPESVESKGR